MAATLPRIQGSTKVGQCPLWRTRCEVSDERGWKIAAIGGFDFALRTVRGGVRRPYRCDSRSEHPRCEGQHLGVEARGAAKGCGPASCRLARRNLAGRNCGARTWPQE